MLVLLLLTGCCWLQASPDARTVEEGSLLCLAHSVLLGHVDEVSLHSSLVNVQDLLMSVRVFQRKLASAWLLQDLWQLGCCKPP